MSYTAASGHPLTAIGIGTIKFRTGFAELIVKNAFYAPNAHTSILSVFRLRQSGYHTEEGPDLTYRICDPENHLIGIAIEYRRTVCMCCLWKLDMCMPLPRRTPYISGIYD